MDTDRQTERDSDRERQRQWQRETETVTERDRDSDRERQREQTWFITQFCWTVWLCCNCIKDRLPDMHSFLNHYPCVIKFSQSDSLSTTTPPPLLFLNLPLKATKPFKLFSLFVCFTFDHTCWINVGLMGFTRICTKEVDNTVVRLSM